MKEPKREPDFTIKENTSLVEYEGMRVWVEEGLCCWNYSDRVEHVIVEDQDGNLMWRDDDGKWILYPAMNDAYHEWLTNKEFDRIVLDKEETDDTTSR